MSDLPIAFFSPVHNNRSVTYGCIALNIHDKCAQMAPGFRLSNFPLISQFRAFCPANAKDIAEFHAATRPVDLERVFSVQIRCGALNGDDLRALRAW
jgi:hypothetical protein